jgi:hypothetical protein
MLHAPPPGGGGSVRTAYIVAQQYADKFPEVTMVELTYGKETPHFQYRFELIRDIEAGTVFFTAKLQNGKIEPLAKLNLEYIGNYSPLRPTESRISQA